MAIILFSKKHFGTHQVPLILYIAYVYFVYAVEVIFIYACINLKVIWGGARSVMVKAMDCGIVVSEFVLQSRYYVHFRAYVLGKGMNPLILPAMG